MRVGFASGVSEGIQKLGRLWLEEAAAPVEGSPELSVLPFSLPLVCPEVMKQWHFTHCFYCLTKPTHLITQITLSIMTGGMTNLKATTT